MRAIGLVLFLAGCPWVAGKGFDERVRDLDGDGGISVRFGGPDCLDDNPEVADCDADGDGYLTTVAGGDDCDDNAGDVHPDAPERCDSVDNDCDGAVDNDDADVQSTNTFYVDADGDGDGDPRTTFACQEFQGNVAVFVTNDDDCNDSSALIHTGATEVCDGLDNNCDGLIDDVGTWFVDADGDGFGNPGVQTVGSCDLANTTGLSATGTDCDDTDGAVYPGAVEVRYDGVDGNCNGGLDDWDADLDGHVPAAHWPAAEAANQLLPAADRWDIVLGDCDDTDPQRFVGNIEVCDGVDNDCDTLVDVDDLSAAGPTEELVLRGQLVGAFADVDGDGHFGTLVQLCPADLDPALHALTNDDCYDGGPSAGFGSVDPTLVYVGAPEICDGVDNDCNQRADWAFAPFTGAVEFYVDGDGDGYGADVVFACGVIPSEGIVGLPGDCNDGDPTSFPAAQEVCGDIVRQDCSTASIWDCDGDGQEGSYLGSGSGVDCNDQDPAIYLTDAAAFEVCDGVDNDCDGLVDSADTDNLDTSTLALWYPDLDDDGWGVDDGFPIQQCDAPSDFAAPRAGDCDDDDPDLNPGTPWFLDEDGDGFGAIGSETIADCLPPDDRTWVRIGGDCNDLDAVYNPETRWYPDVDGDFVGNPSGAQRFCSAPAGTRFALASAGTDCDDEDAAVQGTSTWYRDADSDGWGDLSERIEACAAPVVNGFRYVETFGDCEDDDPTVNPQRLESCNAVDDDCDGLVDDLDPNLVASPGGPLGYQDVDQDGFGIESVSKNFCFALPPGWATSTGDCDDLAPAVYPGAIEICGNGIDDDCSGDEQTPVWYVDADGDGFGAGDPSQPSCDAPVGFTATAAGDCNDAQAATFPGAIERDSCDTIDDNCDGQPEPRLTWTFDNDGDGYGNDDQTVTTCVPPSTSPIPGSSGSWVLAGGDCDDDDPGITFGRLWYVDSDGDGLGNDTAAFFACPVYGPLGNQLPSFLTLDQNGNGVYDLGDEAASIFAGDCDDDNVLVGAARGYRIDLDGDTWGAANVAATLACPDALGNPPAGYVTRGSDCVDRPEDDLDTLVPPNEINPSQIELLDDLADNDCDGFTDVIGGGIAWFEDLDGDGLGGTALQGYEFGAVTNGSDCDDQDPTVANGRYVYTDNDGDGTGTGTPVFLAGVCVVPAGRSAFTGDCNDNNVNIGPTVTEICDGIDQDCDGAVDEGLSEAGFADRDVDGFGDPNTAGRFCPSQPHVTSLGNGADCDDFAANIHPGQPEICDGIDNNCVNGIGDEVRPLWYVDGDGDGVGSNTAFVQACVAPVGAWLPTGGDCNDGNPAIKPGVPEVCNGIDDDCTGGIDDGLASQLVYLDFDGDGAIEPGSDRAVCAVPLGYTTVLGPDDCNDSDAREAPGLPELCGDGLDNDCSGVADDQALRYVDADSDGWGWGFSPRVTASCASPVHADRPGDCSDTDSSRSPDGVDDVCNGVDNDCDNVVDEDVPGDQLARYFRDLDDDGFGNDAFVVFACVQPPGFVDQGGDCDDLRDEAYPFAHELCNGLVEDCTGTTGEIYQLFYPDLDRDGFKDASQFIEVCLGDTPPLPYDLDFFAPDDCDDENALVNADATELCDGIDNDCDGTVDEDGPQYVDGDNDGFGIGSLVNAACSSSGHAVVAGDCNDGNPAVRPSAPTDACNGLDDDCDGVVDENATFTTYFADVDGDTFGSPFLPVRTCGAQPANTATNSLDCDDQRASVKPGEPERCNGIDDNCDNVLPVTELDGDGDGYLACQESNDQDPNDVPGSQIWYRDIDGDGFGNAATATVSLTRPGPDYVLTSTDCNDNDASMSPGNNVEYCDGKDNDCDGAVLLEGSMPVTVDVSNPLRGTVLDPFAHTDSYYAHDFDGDTVFSLEGLVSACGEAEIASLQLPTQTVPLRGLDGDSATILADNPQCLDGSDAGIFVRDIDGDGFPSFDQLADLYVDCGNGPPVGSNWVLFVPFTTQFDCEPFDSQRFRVANNEFGDADGDGRISVLRLNGECIGTPSGSAGDDCNERDAGNADVLGYWTPANQAEFNRLWTTCRVAQYELPAGMELPSGVSPAFSEITVSSMASTSCSPADPNACANGVLHAGSNSNLWVRDLQISGTILVDPGSAVQLSNLSLVDGRVLMDNSSLFVSDVFNDWGGVGPAFDLTDVDATFSRTQIIGYGDTGSEGIRGFRGSLLVLDSEISLVETGLAMQDSTIQAEVGLAGLELLLVPTPVRWDGGFGEVHLRAVSSGTSELLAGSLACVGCVFDDPIDAVWSVPGNQARLELRDSTFQNVNVPGAALIVVDSGQVHLQDVRTIGAIARRLLTANSSDITVDGLVMEDYNGTFPFSVHAGTEVLATRVSANRTSGSSTSFFDITSGSRVEMIDADLTGFAAVDMVGGSEFVMTDSRVDFVDDSNVFNAVDGRIELEQVRVFMSNAQATPPQSYVDLRRSDLLARGSIFNQRNNAVPLLAPFNLREASTVELIDTTVRAVGSTGAMVRTNDPAAAVEFSGVLLDSGTTGCPVSYLGSTQGPRPYLGFHASWMVTDPLMALLGCGGIVDYSVSGNNRGSLQTGAAGYDANFFQTNIAIRALYGETAY